MASGKLSRSLHLSVVLSGLVELPAYAIILLVHSKIGRKSLITGSMLIGGTACICVLIVGSDKRAETLRTALALIGKMGISASFVGIYLHTGEIFPTVVRYSLAQGVAHKLRLPFLGFWVPLLDSVMPGV